MWNRLRSVLAIVAICAGGGILFLEAVLLVSGAWNVRIAAMEDPIDLFSGAFDLSQIEEMDVVNGTVYELCGRYDYTYDDYVTNISYYYILPVETAGHTCYIGIKESQGRKALFRNLSAMTAFDIKEHGLNVRPFQKDMEAEEKPIFVEGFLFRMDEQQYMRFQTWFEKAGYLEGAEADGTILPYYIEERDIARYRQECISGFVWSAASVAMIAGGVLTLVHWRKRRRTQTHITIENVVYEKEQLEPVNLLVEHIEMMQAVQKLSQLTGLDMVHAEKIIRHWYDYWY